MLDDLTRAFDRRGCTGLTIWVNSDGNIQANICGPDKVSWDCHTHRDLRVAVTRAVDAFLEYHTKIIERKAKMPRQLAAEKKAFNDERSAQPKRRKRRRDK